MSLSDSRLCSRVFIADFIKIYRKNECLWKEKDPSFKDKEKRKAAHDELLQLCKRINPEATEHFVVSKLRNLRTSFQRELRKVLGSKDHYEPILWYYDLMLFLVEQDDVDQDSNGQSFSSDGHGATNVKNEIKQENSEHHETREHEMDTDTLETSGPRADLKNIDATNVPLDNLDLRLCTREFVTELIRIYRKNVCLWKKKDRSYKNKSKRDAAYVELVEFCKTFHLNADLSFVKRKMSSIRTTFQREVRKVREAKERYEPTLWYYELMLFLIEEDDEDRPSSSDGEREAPETEEYFSDENFKSVDTTNGSFANSTMRIGTQKFVTDFIEVYRKHVCLWKETGPYYKNRSKSEAAYDELVQLCKMFNPNADLYFVKSKIQCLRSGFRRERRKVNEAKEPYEPSLWYYKLMRFLDEEEENENVQPSSPKDIQQCAVKTQEKIKEHSNESFKLNPRKLSYTDEPGGKLARIVNENGNTAFKPSVDNDTNNEYEAFGTYIVSKLRRMDALQAVYAEMLINRVLCRGLLKKLNKNTDI